MRLKTAASYSVLPLVSISPYFLTPPVGLSDHTRFDPEDGGSMSLRSVGKLCYNQEDHNLTNHRSDHVKKDI
jgi:hypothetical protein